MNNFDYKNSYDPQDPMNKMMGFIMFIFCLALTITFLVLKLCGVIAFSWWWVFSPLWIPMALGLIVMFLINI